MFKFGRSSKIIIGQLEIKNMEGIRDGPLLIIKFIVKLLKDALFGSVFYFFFTQERINSFLEYFQCSDHVFFVFSTALIHFTFYYLLNFSFLYMDTYKVLQSFKIKRPINFPPSKELITDTIKESILGSLVIFPIGFYLAFFVFKYAGMSVLTGRPGFLKYLFQFIVIDFFSTLILYWTHRILHHPKFYKKYHKKHHEFKETIGFAVENSHPVEMMTSNLIPTIFGTLILGAHVSVWLAWVGFRIMEGCTEHSGYDFGYFSISEEAGIHGKNSIVNVFRSSPQCEYWILWSWNLHGHLVWDH
jgi:fatty acid hydroxylase domain-containing protein 2